MADKPSRRHKTRGPKETPGEIKADMTRVRIREERRLITDDNAGYFDIRLSKDQFVGMFRSTIETLKPKRSTLATLGDRKARFAEKKRKDNARRKALFGGFLVAQCRYTPEFHAAIAADIRAFLKNHPSETVAARNIQLLEGFLADPTVHGTGPGSER